MAVALERSPDHSTGARAAWFDRYICGRAGSIYGGTPQIQKNILAQRVLGLPR
jgi:alkylation response protein AidB-like acyl-CoA dehydrogenase